MKPRATKTGQKKLAVIGWPVRHSLSPLIHRHWLAGHHIAASYDALDVAPDALADFLASTAPGLCGFNITIPHKEEVFIYCAQRGWPLSAEAKSAAAVNCVRVRSGRLEGSNTDGSGFIQALGGWQASPQPVVILGAGGAAAGILSALHGSGQKTFRLVNRDQVRAQNLAARFPQAAIEICLWPEREAACARASLLVQTTPLGGLDAPVLDLALDCLPVSARVADIIYRPWHTPLLQQAAARGHAILAGGDMLLAQAAQSFALWFGAAPEISAALRAQLRAAASAPASVPASIQGSL